MEILVKVMACLFVVLVIVLTIYFIEKLVDYLSGIKTNSYAISGITGRIDHVNERIDALEQKVESMSMESEYSLVLKDAINYIENTPLPAANATQMQKAAIRCLKDIIEVIDA